MPGARVKFGERVSLRTVEREDVPFVQRANADPAIRHPLGTRLKNREAMDVAEEGGPDKFLVCREDAERAPPDADVEVSRLGEVHVDDAHYKRPRLGYWLVPSAQGEGYGREAVSLALDYVFRTYDTPAVGAGAFASNEASRGLLESLGFEEEGRRRAFMFVDSEHRDMVEYGLLRADWRDR